MLRDRSAVKTKAEVNIYFLVGFFRLYFLRLFSLFILNAHYKGGKLKRIFWLKEFLWTWKGINFLIEKRTENDFF